MPFHWFLIKKMTCMNSKTTERPVPTLTTRIFIFATKFLCQMASLNQCSHHIETSQLICRVNQLTSFYIMETLVVKRLRYRDGISMCSATVLMERWYICMGSWSRCDQIPRREGSISLFKSLHLCRIYILYMNGVEGW